MSPTPHRDAVRRGAGAAFAGAGADQLALELGKPAKHGQDQAPVRRGGVGPCVAKGTEARAALRDGGQRVKQVARRSREAVKPRDQQHVAGRKLRKGAAKLRAVGLGSAHHLAENLHRSGGAKLLGLSVEALAAPRYPAAPLRNPCRSAHLITSAIFCLASFFFGYLGMVCPPVCEG